jgi:rare lipoprotein A (peptidoglycan hydrolase)
MSAFVTLALYRHLFLLNVLVLAFLMMPSTSSHAKTPGKTYCFRGFCHTVLTLVQIQQRVGTSQIQVTSNYDDCKRDRFNPCGLTSSGAVFEPEKADNAASPLFPDGTIILVRHPRTSRSAVLRINSAGPYHHNRVLDVSRATAEVLGFQREGVANLEVKVLKAPEPTEAKYSHQRVYPEVPGFLGEYASLEQATAGLVGLTTADVQLAGIYPQTTNPVTSPPASVASNGVQPKWLGRNMAVHAHKSTLKTALKRAKKSPTRLSRLEAKKRRLARLG